jgi:hypothetical protein
MVTNSLYHNLGSFDLSFGTTLAKDACDASWGIDDVSIYIK